MHTAGQARVEAADRAHDVNPLKFFGRVLLEDRRALYGVLIWPQCPVGDTRTGVSLCRWIGWRVGNLVAADDVVVREHFSYGFVEGASAGLVRHFVFPPRPRTSGARLSERLLNDVDSAGGGVGLQVCSGAVALDG